MSIEALPGLNSLYLWTGQEPPTTFNTTSWMYLLGPQTQARIVQRIQAIDRLCVVRAEELLAGWQQGRPLAGPLVDYIAQGFIPLDSRNGYEFLVRSSNLQP